MRPRCVNMRYEITKETRSILIKTLSRCMWTIDGSNLRQSLRDSLFGDLDNSISMLNDLEEFDE